MSDDILSLYESLYEKAVSDIEAGVEVNRKQFHTKLVNFVRALDKSSKVMGQRVIGALIYIHNQCNGEGEDKFGIPYEGKGTIKTMSIEYDSKNLPDELVYLLTLYLDSKLGN